MDKLNHFKSNHQSLLTTLTIRSSHCLRTFGSDAAFRNRCARRCSSSSRLITSSMYCDTVACCSSFVASAR